MHGTLLLLASPTVTIVQGATHENFDSNELVPIQMTMLDGNPVIVGNGSYLLPREKPGEKLGFVRQVALAYIGRYPEILDHKRATFDIARLLLTDQAKNQFIVGKLPPETPVWIGENEFEKERAFRSFVEKFGPILADAAPEPPFDFWVIERTSLNRYDFDRRGYKIYGPDIAKPFAIRSDGSAKVRNLTSANVSPPGVSYINYHNTIEIPAFMPMSVDRAEGLTNFLASQDEGDSVYFGAHVTATDVVQFLDQKRRMDSREVTRFAGGILIIKINSLALFADADLTQLIHRYDVTARDQKQ